MPAGRPASLPAFVAALLLLVLLPSAARAASYPPSYHFRTVSTDHVSVHFPQGFETMARQAASMATEILSWHEARYGQKVGRVQIVIVDADDQSNGFASPLPFPLVTIRAVAPDGTDDFGNHEGWLRLVLTHELAHTVHLEESRGPLGLRAEGLRPRAVPLPEHPRHVVDDRGPRHLRGDRAHRLRPRPQPRLADGDPHGGARGALPEGGPGDLRARRVARRPGPVPVRRGVPAPADRAVGRGHDPEDGTPARRAVPALPRRAHGAQGHRHRPPRALDGVGHAGHRGGRAGRRRAGGAGPDAVPPRDRARHPPGLAPLQPRRRVGGLHEPHADPLPADPPRAPRRLGGPPPRPAQRRLRPRLDAGREVARLRGAAGARGRSRSSAT